MSNHGNCMIVSGLTLKSMCEISLLQIGRKQEPYAWFYIVLHDICLIIFNTIVGIIQFHVYKFSNTDRLQSIFKISLIFLMEKYISFILLQKYPNTYYTETCL